MDLQALSDRAGIQDLLARYCHVVDRRDWAAFSALFSDDAVLDYSAFGGPRCGAADMATYLDGALAPIDGTQHTISTSVVELSGDTASARTAAQVMMISAAADGSPHVLFVGLWYRDVLVRTPQGWRIRERTQESAWMHNLPDHAP